jgi:very-short-patch-repair endonuclease
MLPDQFVILKWTNQKSFITHYQSIGYQYTSRGSQFEVDVNHLQLMSQAEITVVCDYCNKIFTKPYAAYNLSRKNLPKDACSDCLQIKAKEAFQHKYGVSNAMYLPQFKEKMKQTTEERYGVENYRNSEEYSIKLKQTSLENWGTEHPFQSDIIKQKIVETNLEKYGVNSVLSLDEVRNKSAKSYYKNGNIRTSKQQKMIFDLLVSNNYNVELNFPVKRYNLDISIVCENGIKIDLEYDCYYWHQKSKKDDSKRDNIVKDSGWKILRVKSASKIPNIVELESLISELSYSNLDYKEIILDDWVELDA